MLIIIDKKIPAEAQKLLSGWGEVVELETIGIVYPAISGHPDIFFCNTPGGLVVSPGLPDKYFRLLENHGIAFLKGSHPPGARHPGSVRYNAATSGEYLVHRLECTDPVILENSHTLKKISVHQGYTRCNLVLLKDHHYLTSDRGIHASLGHHQLEGLYVSPEGILLPGFQNGFIGGTMGLINDRVFINGTLSDFPEGVKVRTYLETLGYEITELSDGPLFDGGGILFL